MDHRETPITSSWLGAVGKGPCPVCDAPITLTFGGGLYILCNNCGEYLQAVDKKLRQLNLAHIASLPSFAAATPWTDIAAARPTNIHFDVEDYLRDAILVKKEGVRVLDAKWPEGCCVCGRRAVREEVAADVIEFTPPGVIRFRDKEVKLIAQGVPYCSDHTDSVRFSGVLFADSSQQSAFGLLFRSYAYRNKFRKLNGWRWPSETFSVPETDPTEKVIVMCPNTNCGQRMRLPVGKSGRVICPACKESFEATT